MAPRVDPVRSDEALPARADVVIVGGGIVGASAALFLAQKGVSVVLCEKGHIAGEQSSRNWGWCRKMGRDPREIPLIIESLRLWQGMNELVEAETGFRQPGIMYLAETPAELAQLESWLDHARQYQLDTRVITAAEAGGLMPGLTGNWAGALYTASDGKAEPQRAAPAIAEAARRHGAAVMQPMRGARHRDRGRPGRRRRHRKGPHRLQFGGARGRRLVAALLRQSRHQIAAAEGAGLGHAHRPDRGRAGDLGLGRPLRLSQADGRRLHGGDARGAHDRPRPRQFPAALRLSAGGAAALEEIALPGRPPLGRGVAHAAALGARRPPRRSRRCARSTPTPTRSSSTARRRPSKRPSRRSSATCGWPRAGAA